MPPDRSFDDTIKIFGKISYASQDPWILQDSIKNNVTFGQTLDQSRYV